MICPDCYKAKISQCIKLEYNKCPDCGGRYKRGEWVSAPRYPINNNEYMELMNTDKVCNAKKVNGVWKCQDVIRVG